MKKTTLTNRMTANELYIVLTNIDKRTFAYSCVCYGDGTPRIYSKDRIDPRVWNQSPVCTTLKSAMNHLLNWRLRVDVIHSVQWHFKEVRSALD